MNDRGDHWQRVKQFLIHDESLGFSLDVSRMAFEEDFLDGMEPAAQKALACMAELETGAQANPDENRMVGHYWLRDPSLAPGKTIPEMIESTIEHIQQFSKHLHEAQVRGERSLPFQQFLLIGIGGSALGPQLLADALGSQQDRLHPWFIDNTDPDGIHRTLAALTDRLDQTLVVVISKSGGTKETRNGLIETRAAYEKAGLGFPAHAVAVTGKGSALERQAQQEGWLEVFPMWDWVGGRTSVCSPVGLLPMALQGLRIDRFLEGARSMDALTRRQDVAGNPALMMALMWYWAGQGRGLRDLVILPYKDRLVLLGRYLQQLIMESLGKERDLQGNLVHQGLVVYGNKGSTDQHAYIQQLREGPNNFFVTFIEVQGESFEDVAAAQVEVEHGITSGDYLGGFLLGTRDALSENGRDSMTLTFRRLNAFTLGSLIALFERTVGFYATMINVNPYHQPGVEAGKKAAQAVIDLQGRLLGRMEGDPRQLTAEQWAETLGEPQQAERIFKILDRLSACPGRGIQRTGGPTPGEATYTRKG